MPTLVHLPADTPTDEIRAVLSRDGAVVLDGLIAADEADAVHAELKPWIDATAPGEDEFSGHRTTRTGALVARSPGCRALMLDRRVSALCEAVLKPNCERYQLHLGQVIRIMPGEKAQMIHRDRWAWGTFLQGIEPQLNTIWALTDFTRENGATQVAPGSIGWPDDRQPTPAEITWAEMRKGSAIVYTGSVFHGGGANATAQDRIGLNLTYTLGWLRQEENQYLSCPPEIARALGPELQHLIGYTMGGYALGYYTPPLPPGKGPELVPPDWGFNAEVASSSLGSAALLDAIISRVSR